jgi:hypothetical protein
MRRCAKAQVAKIERRCADLSVMLPTTCVYLSLCWSWSSAGALDDMLMLPTVRVRLSIDAVRSSVRRLCACVLCRRIKRTSWDSCCNMLECA